MTAPYGSWPSPISAADIARGGHPVGGGCFVGDEVWWVEVRPDESGRNAIRRAGTGCEPEDVLPVPWNARTRVHEYGGGSWTVVGDRELVFAEFTDQRLYRLSPGAGPVPLTPADLGMRFAELTELGPGLPGPGLLCVRETHDEDGVHRDICTVPLDGSAAADATAIRSVVSGSQFLAAPCLSPNGERLAWIAWDHPQMPWDGTELRVGTLDPTGRCAGWSTLLGSTTESVLQPHWRDDQTLFAISDRTGWWNLYQVPLEGALTPLCPAAADFGGPMWMLGSRWYAPLDATRLLTVRTHGSSTLAVLDLGSGELHDLDTGMSAITLGPVRADQVLIGCGSPQLPAGLRCLELDTGELLDVRLSVDELPDPAYLPEVEARTFGADRDVHCFVYAPRHPDAVAPPAELPPYVAFVHGGPTAHVPPLLNPMYAYFTSRGIGVVDVNYGGSSGYGRAYRERLRGQWGVVDVEDTVAAVLALADAGLADRDRLAIRGKSAGGWTVLAALTGTDVFACGASWFGVAELKDFVAQTHDFESRYIDGLIGPLPEAEALYDERAPLNHADGLACPVLLVQGLDDPVVPPAQSERFRDALVSQGIPHAYLAYAGESHGLRRAESIVSALEAELSFYGQVMSFTPPGVPMLELWRR
ncbi:MAG: S9 family peptidase [Nocardioidaceae bacterium]|nr:S9 family peptidase [Nocardioidaceae bacterium]